MMKRPTGRQLQTEGAMNITGFDGTYQRQSGLPAFIGSDRTSIWLCGAIYRKKVGAGTAIRGVSGRKTAGVSIMRLGDTIACPIHHLGDRLKSMQSTPTEGRRLI